MNEASYTIIGAGLSGLHLGQLLKKNPAKTIILEKSPGLGGRVATRRIEGLGFDHGCPLIQDWPDIKSFLNHYLPDSVLKKEQDDFYLTGGMNQLGKAMAQDLTVHRNVRVSYLKREDHKWIVMTDEGPIFQSEKVVLTAPLPQALELLINSDIKLNDENRLRSIQYSKGIMGLFIAKDLPSLFKKIHPEGHELFFMKKRNLHPDGLVFMSNANLSEEYFAQNDFEVLPIIINKIQESLGTALSYSSYQIKRWRYVKPLKSLQSPYLEVAPNLFLIGDSFLYPDIRGSFLSAEALAKVL